MAGRYTRAMARAAAGCGGGQEATHGAGAVTRGLPPPPPKPAGPRPLARKGHQRALRGGRSPYQLHAKPPVPSSRRHRPTPVIKENKGQSSGREGGKGATHRAPSWGWAWPAPRPPVPPFASAFQTCPCTSPKPVRFQAPDGGVPAPTRPLPCRCREDVLKLMTKRSHIRSIVAANGVAARGSRLYARSV